MNKIIGLIAFSIFISYCSSDSSTTSAGTTAAQSSADRFTLGDCSTLMTPATTFSSIYTSFFSLQQSSSSKGCAGSSCHTGSAGGWSMGSSASSAYTSMVGKTANSGLALVTASSLSGSLILTRVNKSSGTMPSGGTLWAEADVTSLARWICQGALNN